MTVKTGMSGNTQKVPQTTTRDVDELNIQASDSLNFAGIQTSQNTEPLNPKATASIRGYHFQFDATINAILSIKGNATLTVEDIEDFNGFPYRPEFGEPAAKAARHHDSSARRRGQFERNTRRTA
jgi:hypothetical protein